MRSVEFITEKKRHKRRSRWAAYGPGPFGGYGFAAGYSGDGGVGEDQDLTELNVAATLKFIKDAHGDQLYGKLPYWRHPRAVAMTGRKIFGSRFNSDAVKAAFLHDVVEDTDTKLSDLEELGFSDRVIEAVSLLTKDSSLTYFQNIDRIITSGNEIAQMVKYADNYENYNSDKSDWSLDRADSSNRKYLQSLNRLGDHLGVKHHIDEASYSGNIGAMEVAKFFRIADDKEKKILKDLIHKNKLGLAWKLIQKVTDVKLQGQEFSEDRTAEVVFDTGEQRKVRYHPTSKNIVDTIIRYYLKQGLRVVKVDDEDIDWDSIPEDLEEGWRDTLAGLALGAGVAMSSPADAKADVEKVVVAPGQTVYSIARAFGTTPEVIQKLNKLDKNFTVKPDQIIKVPKLDTVEIPSKEKKSINSKKSVEKKAEKKIDISKTLTGKPYEALLTRAARSSGITDPIELAAFLAQTSVETGRFKHMREIGNKERIEKMYDLKFNRQGAKILGNTKPGDGWRYRGRGFIQLTGRDNYTRAGRDLGLDLVKDPDLVARDPEIAAKASVWYWKTHVRPQVDDFRDTAAVTKAVQGGSSALDRREREFQNFKQFKLAKI